MIRSPAFDGAEFPANKREETSHYIQRTRHEMRAHFLKLPDGRIYVPNSEYDGDPDLQQALARIPKLAASVAALR
jgi:hypothetical protein